MKPQSFAEWRAATPDGFHVHGQGLALLHQPQGAGRRGRGDRAVPRPGAGASSATGWARSSGSSWPTKKFDRDDFAAFLKLLPRELDGRPLRHAVEVRHESFACPSSSSSPATHGVAICLADNAAVPADRRRHRDFVYARLMTGSDEIETGYAPAELDLWAERLPGTPRGDPPKDFSALSGPAPSIPRDVFAFVIHEGKVRAPGGGDGAGRTA